MDFLSSHEFHLSVIIELILLLLIAVGIILYLVRRLLQLSHHPPPADSDSLLAHFKTALDKTREKKTQLGNNGPEAQQLQAACDLRCHVLEGEIRLLEQEDSTGENHYWRPILDYYEAIHADFSAQIKTLEERLATSQQRIDNLEKFKEKLFDLRDRLNRSYQNNSRLEKELREKIAQGAKLSELEHTLSQMEREKEGLSKELQLAEREFIAIMENAAVGTIKVAELAVNVPAVNYNQAPDSALKARLKEVEEENKFLYEQIQTLLADGVDQKKKKQAKEREYLALEKRYAKMEERYLAVMEELDQRR